MKSNGKCLNTSLMGVTNSLPSQLSVSVLSEGDRNRSRVLTMTADPVNGEPSCDSPKLRKTAGARAPSVSSAGGATTSSVISVSGARARPQMKKPAVPPRSALNTSSFVNQSGTDSLNVSNRNNALSSKNSISSGSNTQTGGISKAVDRALPAATETPNVAIAANAATQRSVQGMEKDASLTQAIRQMSSQLAMISKTVQMLNKRVLITEEAVSRLEKS